MKATAINLKYVKEVILNTECEMSSVYEWRPEVPVKKFKNKLFNFLFGHPGCKAGFYCISDGEFIKRELLEEMYNVTAVGSVLVKPSIRFVYDFRPYTYKDEFFETEGQALDRFSHVCNLIDNVKCNS